MNFKKIFLYMLFCYAVFLNHAGAKERLIISGHPDYPPIMWQKDQTIVGIGPELAGKVLSTLGIDFEIKFCGPWKRVQGTARAGEIDLIVGLYSNKERRMYLDFTVPYMTDPTSIFVMKDKRFPFIKWEDLIGKSGTTMHGDSFGEEFDSFIIEKLRVHKTYDANTSFRLLISGRADYFIWGYYPCLINLYLNGYKDKIVPLPQPVTQEKIYMAFSKESKYLHLLSKINQLILKFKAEGQVDKMIKKHTMYFETK